MILTDNSISSIILVNWAHLWRPYHRLLSPRLLIYPCTFSSRLLIYPCPFSPRLLIYPRPFTACSSTSPLLLLLVHLLPSPLLLPPPHLPPPFSYRLLIYPRSFSYRLLIYPRLFLPLSHLPPPLLSRLLIYSRCHNCPHKLHSDKPCSFEYITATVQLLVKLMEVRRAQEILCATVAYKWCKLTILWRISDTSLQHSSV